MPTKLAVAAAQFLADPQGFRRQWTVPALLWETADAAGPGEELTWSTHAGGLPQRPEVGDPLLLEVQKGKSALNALGFGITVGRTANNDVVLYDATVSRFHAVLSKDERTGGWRVEDAESQNGTFVREVRLAPRTTTPLEDGTPLRFGAVSLLFLTPEGLVRHLERKLKR
ncbi:FHA domain-containing protein [Aggregicoccus sp. 17bor-14]|uniref:FHA domain-containing protein n=1 Tax=Myxococcaceae TaxID=31 RepID=UPI00129CD7F5|nr:FHA domain-containing protein [Simulacricoccus sp. 17bor-14]MRI91627.1 FHA domain-containing protein [Aggregicoccus sp. 17bor-14]